MVTKTGKPLIADFGLTKIQHQITKRVHPGDLIPVLAYDDEYGLFILDENYLAFGFVCYPLQYADETVSQKLQVLVDQDFPSDSFMQFCLWSSPDIKRTLQRMNGLRETELAQQVKKENPALKSVSDERIQFLDEHAFKPVENRNNTRIKDNHVLVLAKIPCAELPTLNNLQTAQKLKNSTRQILDSLEIFPHEIDVQMYIHIMSTMLNWHPGAFWRSDDLRYDDGELIRHQIWDFENGLVNNRDSLYLGGDPKNIKVVKTISPKQYPEYVHVANTISYLGDSLRGTEGTRENVLITANIYYPDPESARTKVQSMLNALTYQTHGGLSRYQKGLIDQKDSFDVLSDALNDGDRVIKFSFCVTLFCDDEVAAVSAVSNAKTYWRNLRFVMQENTALTLPMFLNSLPFSPSKEAILLLQRYRTMAVRHAIQMVPICSEWKGTGTPVFCLISRHGQLMPMDLFEPQLPNNNAVMAAQSGSGKSFLVNHIIYQYQTIGAYCWVIDVGRSYQKLSAKMSGDFMEFTEDSNICLNMFDKLNNFEDQADVIAAVLAAMAAPTQALTDRQNASLKRILKECWDQYGQSLNIDILAAAFKSPLADGPQDERIVDIGEQLYPFTSHGEYGKWFNGPSTITFKNRLTVLELQELEGRKHLQQVVLLLLISHIQQAMYGLPKNIYKQVIIDEAWSLLTDAVVADFMVRGFRTYRKHNGSAMIVTQAVDDLYSTPGGEAMAKNSAIKFILSQTPEAIEQLKRQGRLSLGERGYDVLRTLHKAQGNYSEVFVVTEMGAGIGRLIVSRTEQLRNSTQPNEVEAINKLMAKGYSSEEAIAILVEIESKQS